MFNIGPGELAIILIAALIVLGPKRLPELARTLGKFLREFRRQTDDVRNLVEREFYKMDQQLNETPNATPAKPPLELPVASSPLAPDPSRAMTQPVAHAVTDPGHDEQGRLVSPPPPLSKPGGS